ITATNQDIQRNPVSAAKRVLNWRQRLRNRVSTNNYRHQPRYSEKPGFCRQTSPKLATKSFSPSALSAPSAVHQSYQKKIIKSC
ncbi:MULTISPECIES: hypothetical protein, partial [unclassified Microcoleus]|uniref:hypothetical protein n=1 Tax=unclassified Microcoleus TaxID=2642155 RepID=UPI002FCE6B2C